MRLCGVRDTRDDGEPSLVGDVIDQFVRREDGERLVVVWDGGLGRLGVPACLN